jgi:hypothetical protein
MTESTFGESLTGPVADVVVRNWGVLIVLMGGMLIYASGKPELRPMALVVAGTSKAAFVMLVLFHGGRFLSYGAGMAVVIEAAWVAGALPDDCAKGTHAARWRTSDSHSVIMSDRTRSR